jgi:hypothetical protein
MDILAKHSKERAKWCYSTAAPFRTMECSIKRAWQSDPELSEAYVYDTLCRKARQGKLGVTRCASRTDDCVVCGCWDQSVSKSVENLYADSEARLEAASPVFLAQWRNTEKLEFPNLAEFRRAESPRYAELFLSFLHNDRDATSSVPLQEAMGIASPPT